MGHDRKLAAASATIRELHERLRVVQTHAWTMQLVAACLLERFCAPKGSCLLPLELRQQSIDLEWGVRTDVLEDDTMAVQLLKPRVGGLAGPEGGEVTIENPKKKKRR